MTRLRQATLQLGLCCGIAAPILWVALIGIAGALRPEFSLVTDYISELGELGSPGETGVRFGAFVFTGALYICFAAAVATAFPGRWGCAVAAGLIALDGIGRIGAGVYPCDPGCLGHSTNQELHRLFATIGFGSGIVAAIGWGLIAWSEQRRRFAWYSVATGLAAAVLLLVMSSEPAPGIPGLLEHAASALLSIWLLVFAARLSSSRHGR